MRTASIPQRMRRHRVAMPADVANRALWPPRHYCACWVLGSEEPKNAWHSPCRKRPHWTICGRKPPACCRGARIGGPFCHDAGGPTLWRVNQISSLFMGSSSMTLRSTVPWTGTLSSRAMHSMGRTTRYSPLQRRDHAPTRNYSTCTRCSRSILTDALRSSAYPRTNTTSRSSAARFPTPCR